ncbi:NAD(P)-binding domain-containing protein [Candidatus Saccharibacteria bacterium]|nr:NAD(P)-binding domain-containing protein [Candidatus Saccharibacteria bacterium]
MKDFIGIVGFGELGSRLAGQIISSGQAVMVYEENPSRRNLNQIEKNMLKRPVKATGAKIHFATDISEVLENCPIIHFAISAHTTESLPILREDQIGILHDSVMTSSLNAAKQRADKSQLIIAHCLMNSVGRVFMAQDFGTKTNLEIAVQHFQKIELEPKFTTVDDHDNLMAKSQALALSLVRTGVHEDLKQAAIANDLTPSGEQILHSLNHIEMIWTPETIASLLKNPYIEN